MSYTATQTPSNGAIYPKNLVPEVILSQVTDEVTIHLLQSDSVIFEGSYTPDVLGHVSVDLCELFTEWLNTSLPNTNTFLQTEWKKQFTLKIEDEDAQNTINFYVCNADFKSRTAWTTWLASNFLTNQPMEQMSCKDAPHWLSFYDANGGLSLVGRFYKKSGGNVDVNICTTNGAGCYTCNVSYDKLIRRIVALPSSLHGYYDVLLMDGDDIKAKQRYIYSERTGREQYYCFVNALGGIDTLICQGENVLNPDITYNIGRFGKSFRQLDDTDTIRAWSQNTGLLPVDWRNWFYEIMAVKAGAWRYDGKSYTDIVLKESSIAASNHGQLNSYTFGYILTENTSVIGSDERAAYAFRQSAADSAEEYESDIKTMELAFTDGVTETIPIPAKVILVLATADAVVEATPISYLVDGTVVDDFTPSTTEPVQIALPAGDELSFETENVSVNGLILNYYPQTPT